MPDKICVGERLYENMSWAGSNEEPPVSDKDTHEDSEDGVSDDNSDGDSDDDSDDDSDESSDSDVDDETRWNAKAAELARKSKAFIGSLLRSDPEISSYGRKRRAAPATNTPPVRKFVTCLFIVCLFVCLFV